MHETKIQSTEEMNRRLVEIQCTVKQDVLDEATDQLLVLLWFVIQVVCRATKITTFVFTFST